MEAIIGLLVLSIVGVALGSMFIGALNSTTNAQLKKRQAALASGVWERINASGTWTKEPGCRAAPYVCAVPDSVFRSVVDDTEGASAFRIDTTATGVDAPSDGLGQTDTDGQVPDIFSVVVKVSHTGKSATGKIQPYSLSGTFDPSKAGSAGSVKLQVCKVGPQADERLTLTSCVANGAVRRLAAPDAWVSGAASDAESEAWIGAMNYPAPLLDIRVEPVANTTVRLRPDNGGPAKTAVTNATGNVVIGDLTPGAYTVEVDAGDSLVGWETKSIPSSSSIAVSAGEQVRSLHMLQPRPVEVKLDLYTEEPGDESEAVAGDYDTAITGGYWLRLMPLPINRSRFWDAARLSETWRERTGWTYVAPGSRTVSMRLAPGLYAAAVLKQTGANAMEIHGDLVLTGDDVDASPDAYLDDPSFIWVDPSGEASAHLPHQGGASESAILPKFAECPECAPEPFYGASGGG